MRAAEEGAALAAPAPLDLRANTLKTTREKVIAALGESPKLQGAAVADAVCAGRRAHSVDAGADVSLGDGADRFSKAGSRCRTKAASLAAMLSEAAPGMQVADVCAGGGGKTLALAALMQNKGQIYAYDVDGRRLAPLKERADRAGAHNMQIRTPMRTKDALEDLRGRMDVVLVDAPCTGSGTWRRNPGFEVAPAAECAGEAAGGAARGVGDGGAAGEAGRAAGVCDVFGVAGGE